MSHAVQYAFYTMLVMDHHGNALPIGFIISAREDAQTLAHCMRLFVTAAQSECPGWRPSCFVTDDDLAEHKAVRCALPPGPLISSIAAESVAHLMWQSLSAL